MKKVSVALIRENIAVTILLEQQAGLETGFKHSRHVALG